MPRQDSNLRPSGANPTHAVRIALDRDGDVAWHLHEDGQTPGTAGGDAIQAWTPPTVHTLDSAQSDIFASLRFSSPRQLNWISCGQPRSYTFH